jgi:hypothetical protein
MISLDKALLPMHGTCYWDININYSEVFLILMVKLIQIIHIDLPSNILERIIH